VFLDCQEKIDHLSFGDFLGASPHLHIIAADGCFKESGMFYTSPAGIDADLPEPLFRHKVLSMLKKKGLITDLRFFPPALLLFPDCHYP